MKFISQFGAVAARGYPVRPQKRKIDPWLSHGDLFVGYGRATTNSGAWCATFIWGIHDGNVYAYMYGGLGPQPAASALIDAMQMFNGWPLQYARVNGEGYNTVMRPTLFAKINVNDLTAWQMSN